MNANARDYITSFPYPERFHREHAPSWLRATLTALGVAAPAAGRGRWCEIGCGTGYGACILAAANPDMDFVGLDINAGHIETARQLAADAGLTNVSFIHGDIADPGQDFGHFDFIVAHGIYSWVSLAIRSAIMTFAGRSLAVGGVFYLHYMAQPGAAAFTTFHDTFKQMTRLHDGDAAAGIRDGLRLLETLRQAGAGYFVAHPTAGSTLEHLGKEELGYIAHEYLNDHFAPLHVADVMQAGKSAGLSFVGSATPIENIDALSIPENTLATIRQVQDPALRESLKDVARNQALRRDLYMREPRVLDARSHGAALGELAFCALPGAPSQGPLALETWIGPVHLAAAALTPVLSRLVEQPHGFASLSRAIPDMPIGMLNQTLHVLMGAGVVHPVLAGEADNTPVERLNGLLMDRLRNGQRIPALASAQTGSGLPL